MPLKHYAWSAEVQGHWKSYPVRVVGPSPSRCCNQPTLLVQSMEGGFVTVNCSKVGCNKKAPFSEAGFEALNLWVSCPECKAAMVPGMVEKNYGYTCTACSIYVRLADLLPSWVDVARK